jgi:osmotically-inducible protein OsmY
MEAPAEEQPPHYLVEKAREALALDERVNELEIKVKIYGKRVFLTGVVSTQERRDSIDDVMHEVLPGYEVQNETTVGSFDRPAEEEQLS